VGTPTHTAVAAAQQPQGLHVERASSRLLYLMLHSRPLTGAELKAMSQNTASAEHAALGRPVRGRSWAAGSALLLVLLTVAVTPLATAQPSATEVVVYSPFGVGEGLVEKVGWQSPGVCSQGSTADRRANAWFCLNAPRCHGHCIRIRSYDPCFSGSRTARFVVCPLSPGDGVPVGAPFGAYVMRLNLIEPLPVTSADAGGPDTNGNPIAIGLANGATCTLELVPIPTTTTGPNPSMYVCPNGYAARRTPPPSIARKRHG
jgi:hypothetical protein